MSAKPQPRRRVSPFWLLASTVMAAAVALCARDKLRREGPAAAASGRALGNYPMREPGIGRAEAEAALAADAERREERFRDAADPGHLWRATRIDERELGRRAPADVFALGAQLFNQRFSRHEGFGGKDSPGLRRVHVGARGGPDAYSCAECHRRGGPAGGGEGTDNAFLDGDGDRPASAFERNPIPLAGAGLVELLAREMTAELQRQQREARDAAKKAGQPLRVALTAKGVSFGFVTAQPDGGFDSAELSGVERDLKVRPFGWKGHAASLHDMVEDELAIDHGIQSARLGRSDDRARVGPFAAPDPDGDGVVDEIGAGQLGALTLFVAMQEVPEVDLPDPSELTALFPVGRQRFEELGCAGCHVPALRLDSAVYTLPLGDGSTVSIDLAEHGALPRIQRAEGGGYLVELFSDLKRHVMGPNLREDRSYKNVLGSQFLTRPLWGLARSRPYLHDGRAPTLDEAILAHSGEALTARDAYAALDNHGRAPIRVFLVALTRAPRISAP